MPEASPLPGTWGPHGCRAAVSVTFDNLGEAADLERGLWPSNKPLGQHPSVTHALPAILEMLQELSLHATFFIEGLSVEMYHAAISEIIKDGHEIGSHAWRHEAWQQLDAAQEEQILKRSIAALAKSGIRPRGFRPPGGGLTSTSSRLYKEVGFTYCSPSSAHARTGIADGLVFLPFEWRCVDAFYYLAHFGDLRALHGEPYDTLPASYLYTAMHSALEECIQQGSYLSFIFHPFLEEDGERIEVMRSLLKELRDCAQDDIVWCAPCGEIAGWMLEHPKDFTTTLPLHPGQQ